MLKTFIQKTFNHFGYHLSLSKVTSNPLQSQTAFIHIAKCGGISIDNALREQLATPIDSRLCRDTSIASSIASFDTISNDRDRFAEHHLQQLQGTLDHFLSLKRCYVSGHWATNSTLLDKYNHISFITVLRDPAARLKSNYIFNKISNQLAIMPPNNLNTDNIVAEAEEILFGLRGWQMANTQTAFICGKYPESKQEAKDLAPIFYKNISQFKVVGVLEDLPAFEKKFELTFKKPLNIKSRNNTESLVTTQNRHVQATLLDYFTQSKVKKHIDILCQDELRKYDTIRQAL